jgi:signal transduction histidine kinase
VPRHADYCVIHLLADEGTIEKSAIARRARDGNGITELLRVFPVTRQPSRLIAQVARTGESVVLTKMEAADVAQLVRGRGHQARLAKLGLRSLMALPLQGRERVLGVICYLRSATNKSFEGHRVALAREMAERIALALDNAELHKRAQEATRIRDEVLRVVAHDLRNPLNTISLTSDFLRIKLSGESQEPWMSKLDIITRSVLHANRLIEDLLDVARLQTGRMTVEPQIMKVGQLISEVVQMHQPLAEDRGLRIRVDINGDCGFILADPARAMQVFSNLIGNAIKFSPRDTELLLRARHLDGKICFSIRDHGRGITDKEQPHLFDPFWQARKGKGGVGMGLPIARAIIQAHGGRIWFESKPGLGTTFYFTLPVAHVNSTSEAAAD